MGAPKGNRFWELRSKHGRDKLFETPELLWQAACEYFKWCEDNPFMETEQARGNSYYVDKDDETGLKTFAPNLIELPKMRPFTLYGLCLYLDCSTSYFRAFKSTATEKSKDFITVIEKMEEIIYNQKFSGAAAGFLNANIIARDLGLIDKGELTADISVKQITGMTVT